ncbi:unnamed protein product [Caenorhabditis auriculariae]|uniref:Timeless N-terminal domain-containing protein n=1 Tax=Caenorhabditis auriculariae TaxID=2777116 RepID=A0A8S1GYF8_9PELO|nr:unnamed protein product [Caenorhabditis auriculariae]
MFLGSQPASVIYRNHMFLGSQPASRMEVLVQGTVNALGYLEDGKYYREPDCYETMRDLIRYLRSDTPTLTARVECGRHNVISQDLIPILKTDDLTSEMFDVAVRLLVNLCQPAIASMQGKTPEDREQWQLYWALEENLLRAKSAFADPEFFRVLKGKLETYFLKTDWEDREEDSRLLMERIILLIRFVFSIRPTGNDLRSYFDTSHDKLVSAFLTAGLDEVLIQIASEPKEKEFHVAIVDIFALLLKEHTPEELLTTNEEVLAAERKAAEEELRAARERESVKVLQRRQSLSSRHSRFGGSYVVKGMQSLSSKSEMIVLKPVQAVSDLKFLDERKKKKRIAKNRRPFEIDQNTHETTTELRRLLSQMVERIMEKCFLRIMKSAKQMVFEIRAAGHRNSEINYFFLMKFVLRFCRLSGKSLQKVNCCIGVEAFHEVQLKLDNYLESTSVLKGNEAKSMGLKAQYALSAFNELILLHQYAADKGNEEEKNDGKGAIQHILRVEEYRELSPLLFSKFSPGVLSKNFLRELITTTHNYLRLLEKSSKKGDLKSVTKRTKIRKPKTKKRNAGSQAGIDTMKQTELDELWKSIEKELQGVLTGFALEEEVTPLNVVLDVEEIQHQQFAMLSVQRSIRSQLLTDALKLYRSARKWWPDQGLFGTEGIPVGEELKELREIFFADLSEVIEGLKKAETDAGVDQNEEDEEKESDVDEEDEEDKPAYNVSEIAFDFDNFVAKYAKSDVLQWYVYVLADFKKNSVELNKAIVKMLHRIAFDLKMTSRIYQLSLFRVFSQVGEYFSCLPKEEHKSSPFFELHTFGFHVLKKFFTAYSTLQDKLVVEVLFWKNARESYEIDHGYGSFEQDRETEARVWTEELEEEAKHLYEEYRDMEERPADIDVLDFIEHNLSRGRTRKQIYKKLKEFGLDTLGAKSNKGSGDSNLPVLELKRVHDEWNSREDKDKVDLVNLICEQLSESYGTVSRSKVIKQLAFADILYEKPKKPRRLPEWPEDLIAELTKLKEQYEEIDYAEQLLGCNIVQYIRKKLSEKKPTSHIERFLESMGVSVPQRPPKTNKKSTKKIIVTNSDDEEEDVEPPQSDVESDHEAIIRDDEDVDDEAEAVKEPVVSKKVEESPKKNNHLKELLAKVATDPTNTLQNRLKSRKRQFAQLFDSDNESSDDDEIVLSQNRNTGEEEPESRQSSKSPDASSVQQVKKAPRIITSSDEED